MIKLIKILEAIHVELPKGYKDNDEDKKRDFITIPSATPEDKGTGKMSWDVLYKDSNKKINKRIMFANTYKTLKKLADEFEYVASLPTYKNDGEIHTFVKTLRTLEKRYMEYLINKSKGK